MQFSTKIDGFEQKDSQGFENSYNSYEQYPLEKFFIFTIYQNYTLALNHFTKRNSMEYILKKNFITQSYRPPKLFMNILYRVSQKKLYTFEMAAE